MIFNKRQLDSEGYCTVSILDPVSIETTLNLFDEFKDEYANRSAKFVSTMHIDDPNHRKDVSSRIRVHVEKQVQVLLPDYEVLFANLLMKKSGANGSVGIHADWTYVDEDAFTSYNLWIPLVNVNEENGCLHMWPQSHRLTSKIRPTPYVPFTREEEQKARLHSEPVTLNAGQGLLYHSGILHFSNPNYTEEDRPALAMVLKPKECDPIHYFRDSAQSVFKYTVNRDFFFQHKLEEEPVGFEPDHRIPFQNIDLFENTNQQLSDNACEVSKYYDKWTPAYEEIYGNVIQAFRPSETSELLDVICERARIQDGHALVDAGCGVCGPAVHIAKKFDVTIDAITVSDEQVAKGNQLIRQYNLENHIRCRNADFRFMNGVGKSSKDGVLFLESLGHCSDPLLAIDASYNVLKEGGFLYIKDFFARSSSSPKVAQRIEKSVKNINDAYAYHVLKLPEVLSILSRSGFIIDFISSFNFDSDTKVRAEFESRFDISVFHDGEFELAEWLEIRAVKHFSEDER